jgi:hypothetical protein
MYQINFRTHPLPYGSTAIHVHYHTSRFKRRPWAGTPYRRSEYLNSGKRSEQSQWLLEKYRSRGRSAVTLWLSTTTTTKIIII